MAEIMLANEASDPAIAQIHRELAALHRRQMMELVERAESNRPKPLPGVSPRQAS